MQDALPGTGPLGISIEETRPGMVINTKPIDYLQDTVPSRTLTQSEAPLPGEYFRMDRYAAFASLIEITKHLGGVTEQNREQAAKTFSFINTAFNIYEGRQTFQEATGISLDKVQYGFAVPARGESAAEAKQVLPIMEFLQPDVNPDHRKLYRNLLSTLPPFILAVYADNSLEEPEKNPVGVCVYIPQDLEKLETIYEATQTDAFQTTQEHIQGASKAIRKGILGIPEFTKNSMHIAVDSMLRTGSFITMIQGALSRRESIKRLNEGILFLERVAENAEYVGLGAILPAISDLGNAIDKRLRTLRTTGHRLTIFAMQQTLNKIFEIDNVKLEDEVTVGVVGLGYIGTSAAHGFLENHPNGKLLIHDKNIAKLRAVAKKLEQEFPGRIQIAETADNVFSNTKYIFSAPRGKVDLPKDKKYPGLVDIDDSEPPSYEAKQLSIQEGIIVKPLINPNGSGIRRYGVNYLEGGITAYDFGYIEEEDGTYGPGIAAKALFGCEGECALAYQWRKANPYSRINPILFSGKPVRPEDVARIYHLVDQAGFALEVDTLQGGGVLVGNKLRATSNLRRN